MKMEIPADKAKEELIAKFLSGNCSENEITEIELWIKASPENQQYFDSIKIIWEQSRLNFVEWNENRAYIKIKERIGNNYKANHVMGGKNNFPKIFASPAYSILGIAASILIIFTALFVYNKLNINNPNIKPQIDLIESSTKIGEIKKIYLNDGSVITLNSTSKLRYPPEFIKTREVYLEGEAFFDVARNPDKPFVVHLENADIKVLGTKFNVNGWRGEKKYRVVVETGKVSFSTPAGKSNSTGVILTKNQMSIMEAGKMPSLPIPTNVKAQTAWLDGSILFDKTPLNEVISRLEKKFDVSITVTNNDLLSRLLTASFKNNNIDMIIKTIGKALDLKYTLNGKEVIYY